MTQPEDTAPKMATIDDVRRKLAHLEVMKKADIKEVNDEATMKRERLYAFHLKLSSPWKRLLNTMLREAEALDSQAEPDPETSESTDE